MIGFNYLGKLGQLGNQMFQYATVLGVAEGIGTSCCIPKHREVMDDGIGNKLRIELFDAFKINSKNVGFLPALDKKETTFTYDDSFLDLDPNQDTNLIGFFQTPKYFNHIKDMVKKEFTFRDEIVNECKEVLELFEDPIALHIRRGDYLINNANHHNLTMEYYEQALKHFPKEQQVVIFSDDPEWCHEQLLFVDDRFVVSEGNSSYHDLYLMTQCSDFIIANSTYSWWGAWLADRGKVIVPHKWFGPNNSKNSLKDLYPEHWTVIPYS